MIFLKKKDEKEIQKQADQQKMKQATVSKEARTCNHSDQSFKHSITEFINNLYLLLIKNKLRE